MPPATDTWEPVEFTVPYQLHDFQLAFFNDYCFQVDEVARVGDAFLYSSPTGSGKSLMALSALAHDSHALLITPRLEIVAGMLEKIGVAGVDTWSDTRLAKEALRYRITTPVRLVNMLAAGTLPFHPARLIIDEVHHSEADTYKAIQAYLPHCVRVGLTATPFRGTPKSTAEFLKQWGDRVTQVLTLPQAAERGIVEIPDVELWPLVDDDTLEVSNGEIRAQTAGDAAQPRLAEVVERCRGMVTGEVTAYGQDAVANCIPLYKWDRPTLFAVPTTDCVHDLVERLTRAGFPALGITQDTPRSQRNDAFRLCVARQAAIVQINVVSEGVDLPIRRIIDLRPTLSPVWWMQMLGRATRPLRPGELPSLYVCTNRNLERHGYLMQGLFPAQVMAQAQKQFSQPSRRAGARAIGLESLGKFTPAEVQCLDGTTATMYALYANRGFERTDYCVLLHPCVEQPLVAARRSTKDESGAVAWGRWQRIESLPVDLRGFQSSPASEVSDKQAAWWQRAAVRCGLDPSERPNRKNFAALPVLSDLKVKLRVGGF